MTKTRRTKNSSTKKMLPIALVIVVAVAGLFFYINSGAILPAQAAVAVQRVTPFSASPLGGVAPLAVTFTSTGAAGSNLGSKVNFGDGTSGTLQLNPNTCSTCAQSKSVAHTYTSLGNYTATLLGATGAPMASTTILVTSFSATPTGGVAPATIVFNSTGGPGSGLGRSVDFGDGTTGNLQPTSNPNQDAVAHIYTSLGKYTATLLSASGAPMASATVRITSFTSSTAGGVAPVTVVFAARGPAGSYLGSAVNFGDSTTSTPLQPTASNPNQISATHVYSALGDYTATLLNSSGAAMASTSITITSFFGSPDSGVAPLKVIFASLGPPNGTGDIGTAVNFGDGTSGTLTKTPLPNFDSVLHVYSAVGTYTATLLSSTGATLATATISVGQ